MIVPMIRTAFVLQVFIFIGLAAKTNFASRILEFDLGAHHKLFLIIFVLLAFLSLYPRIAEFLANSVKDNLRYVLFLTVIGLLSLETILRIIYPNEYPTYSHLMDNKRFMIDGKKSTFSGIRKKGDYFAFEAKKNLNNHFSDLQYSSSMNVQTNKDGFRFLDNEKSEKIMVLGDSLTFGTGVDNGETYADQLSKLMKSKYNFHNYSVEGWGFAEYYLAHKLFSKKHNFSLVIMGVFPGNDFGNLVNSHWAGKEEGALPVPPLKRDDFMSDGEGNQVGISPFYRTPAIREIAVLAFIEKLIMVPFRRFLKTSLQDQLNKLSTEEMSLKIISDISKKSNLLVIILPPAYHYPSIYTPDNYVKKLNSIEGVKVLNYYPILADKYKDLYIADKTHFNAKGNYLIAQKLSEFIKRNSLF